MIRRSIFLLAILGTTESAVVVCQVQPQPLKSLKFPKLSWPNRPGESFALTGERRLGPRRRKLCGQESAVVSADRPRPAAMFPTHIRLSRSTFEKERLGKSNRPRLHCRMGIRSCCLRCEGLRLPDSSAMGLFRARILSAVAPRAMSTPIPCVRRLTDNAFV